MEGHRTFADELPIKQISSHKYQVDFREEWCIGSVPNGGYVTSAFLVAARTHMTLTNPTKSGPHPINIHLEFFRRTAAARGVFTVQDIKLGRRISNLHLTFSQERDDGKGWEDKVQAYVTMTDITKEEGVSMETRHTLHPPPLDVDLDALASKGEDKNWARRAKEPFGKFRRAHKHLQSHVVRPERKPVDVPVAITDIWERLVFNGKVHGRWTNDSLGLNVDIFPQVIEKFVNAKAEMAAIQTSTATAEEVDKWAREASARSGAFWYPTLILNLNVLKALPSEGVEWLFVRLRAKTIKNGRYDLDIEVWDAEGDLVATSTHAVLAVDASRNLRRAKKNDAKI